jgi:alpha-tubulin suppressor-like RCC1 family protein
MRKRLTRCAVAAALIGVVLLVVVHQLRAPPISVGRALPPGKVKPQLVNAFNKAVLIAPDGSLWAWGGRERMENGGWSFARVLPNTADLQVPQRIGSETNWTQVSEAFQSTVALKRDGSLWHWGWWPGQPTPFPLKFVTIPTRIGSETNWSQVCGSAHNLALKNDGSLWAWGFNNYGQIGDGTTNDASVPTMIGMDRDWRMIAANDANSFALKKNGTIWGWGWGGTAFGRGGAGDTNDNLTPQQIAPGTNWRTISASGFALLALKFDGTLWLKGMNAHVVASAFVPTATNEFTQIGSDGDWAEIYAGWNSFFARKKDGSWWVSGQNRDGNLGLGTNVTTVAAPQRLPFDFEAWAFAPGADTTLMLGKDGKLWSWGKRLGAGQPSAARQKFEAFIAPVLRRFPSLHFLIKPDIDYTPHLLWELPPELRRSLGTGPNSATNHLTFGQPADTTQK